LTNLNIFETAYRSRQRARWTATVAVTAVLLSALWLSAIVSEAFPSTLAAGLPRVGEYFQKLMPDPRWAALFSGTQTEGSVAYWFYRWDKWLYLLFETSQMAALATFGGATLAFLLCFPVASNLAPNRAIYTIFRRGLELFRTVPDIVYALILVWAVGVGPLASPDRTSPGPSTSIRPPSIASLTDSRLMLLFCSAQPHSPLQARKRLCVARRLAWRQLGHSG